MRRICQAVWGREPRTISRLCTRHRKMFRGFPKTSPRRSKGGSRYGGGSGMCKSWRKRHGLLCCWASWRAAGFWEPQNGLSGNANLFRADKKGNGRRYPGLPLEWDTARPREKTGHKRSLRAIHVGSNAVFLPGGCGLFGHGSIYGCCSTPGRP